MMRALDQMQVREALRRTNPGGRSVPGDLSRSAGAVRTSEEAPEERGLGLFPGEIRRFPATARVPHMGWNEIEPRNAREAAWRIWRRILICISRTATTRR